MHELSLLVIAAAALFAWRTGQRWCGACAVAERASARVLACIVPIAGVVAATHLVATINLIAGVAIVSPPAIAAVFVLLTIATTAAVNRLLPTGNFSVLERPPLPAPPPRRWTWPGLIVAAVYALFFFDAVLRYPTGVDGLHYHLPVAAEWIRTGRMDLITGLRLQSLPENGMIVPALLLAAKLESLVTLAFLPYGLLIGGAIYCLARRLGGSVPSSMVSAGVALSVPIVLFQSFSSYIDVYAAAAWLCSLLAIVWATRAPTPRARYGLTILGGLAAGVALGSKSTFLVLVAMLAAVVVRAQWFRFAPGTPHQHRPLVSVAVFLLASLPCSGYWFARGIAQAGNPVYPLAVEVAGHRVLPGFTADCAPCYQKRSPVEKLKRWWAYPWHETKYSGTGYPYGVNNGLGAPYAMLVPLSVLSVLTGFIRHRPRSWTDRWLVATVVLFLGGLVLHLTVFREMLRFVLPCVLVAVPVTALLLDRLRLSFPRALPRMITLAFATTATVAALKPAHAVAGRVKDGVWTRADFYEIPGLVDHLPPASRVLNLASPYDTYPLLGAGLDLDVVSPHHWALWTGGQTTAEALYDHNIDYVYYRPVYCNSWREDLPLKVLYDDATEKDPLPGPPRRLFRVLPWERHVAPTGQATHAALASKSSG